MTNTDVETTKTKTKKKAPATAKKSKGLSFAETLGFEAGGARADFLNAMFAAKGKDVDLGVLYASTLKPHGFRPENVPAMLHFVSKRVKDRAPEYDVAVTRYQRSEATVRLFKI